MTAPVPTSPEVTWHEAQEDARSSARGLGTAIIAATLILGVTVAWVATGWVWAAGYTALWVGCTAIVRRLP